MKEEEKMLLQVLFSQKCHSILSILVIADYWTTEFEVLNSLQLTALKSSPHVIRDFVIAETPVTQNAPVLSNALCMG